MYPFGMILNVVHSYSYVFRILNVYVYGCTIFQSIHEVDTSIVNYQLSIQTGSSFGEIAELTKPPPLRGAP